MMTRQCLFSTMALGLVAAAGMMVLLPADAREVPLPDRLLTIPLTIDEWMSGTDEPALFPVDPQAQESLSRTYRYGSQTIWVAIGYYPRQVEGRRPAANTLLYPTPAWSLQSERTVHLDIADQRPDGLSARFALIRLANREVAVLYWYQVGARSIANTHAYRLQLLYDRIVHRRASGAFVRIAAPVAAGANPEAVLASQQDFLRSFYGEFMRRFSR